MGALALKSDIITASYKILEEWKKNEMSLDGRKYEKGELVDIPYENLDLNQAWNDFDLKEELTNKGIDQFAADWNSLIDT